MIKPCTCEHEYQDEQYGNKMRVHNLATKNKTYRCTVCTKEKSGSDNTSTSDKKKAKKK